jgi:hypothetical protein
MPEHSLGHRTSADISCTDHQYVKAFHRYCPYVFFCLPSRMLIDLSSILFHNIFSTMSTGMPINTSSIPISIEGVLYGKQRKFSRKK